MLSELNPLFIDCQSTGASPANSALLEIAWNQHAHVILQSGEVPKRILKLVGISNDEIAAGISYECAWNNLCHTIQQETPVIAVAHFARFEQSFLDRMWADHNAHKFPLPLFCTHRIAKLLFPDLPSHGLRALAGWFDKPLSDGKRALGHVEATRVIWQCLVEEMHRRNITTIEALNSFVQQKPGRAPTRKQFLISKEQRLGLPNKPGIYRYVDRSGNVLYVGKATSLKHRVNSYFTGGCRRDHRKREMLAQAIDVQTEVTDTPLAAGLREFSEIRRLAPRYNIALQSTEKYATSLAPAMPRWLVREFYGLTDETIFRAGFEMWLTRVGLTAESQLSEHDLLNFGVPGFKTWLAQERERHAEKMAGLSEGEKSERDEEQEEGEASEEPEEEFVWTSEAVADHIPTALRRGVRELIRGRWLRRLHNAEVLYRTKTCKSDRIVAPSTAPFNPQDTAYARVLLGELRRVANGGGSWQVVKPWPMHAPFWI